jgi:hypothetical protein
MEVLSFTPLPLYFQGTHWIGGWVGLRAGLDAVEVIFSIYSFSTTEMATVTRES